MGFVTGTTTSNEYQYHFESTLSTIELCVVELFGWAAILSAFLCHTLQLNTMN
jgi:hypothetical protein